ncbi:M48 family metallopeptidase [Herminiimonas sp. CN]|uniref:M48 family metallopeptidase n=1 Tax=Herminiimonas sp. CN TaxID=1349818 RepID=UPI000A7DF5F3|nr:SprT family zinc-dependent metalloprotease [Herminiimonas sp. CN]
MPKTVPSVVRRSVALDGAVLEYALRRSRRRSIGFLIDDRGLRVSAPDWLTLAAIEDAIRSKQDWIRSKLQQRRERALQPQHRQQAWGDGSLLPYLGAHLTLRLWHTRTVRIDFDAIKGELHLHLPEGSSQQQLQIHLQRWLQAQARRLFNQRLPHYAEKLGASYHSFALSSARTQWGSCTSQRKIRLNWRLIHFPLTLIDYVVAHELAHLREMNHSPRFWATVASIYPEYAAARQQLREQARALPPLL